jgi:catechol 2,3-dioxygenase-like lactoylglutathione lyase family enzyme
MTDTSQLITGTDFVGIPVQDAEAAAEFYGDTLGLPRRKQWGQMPAYEYDAGQLTLALMQTDAFGLEFRPNVAPITMHVDDVDAARAELESKGVVFGADTIDSGVCKMAFFADPDGNALGIHNRYATGA